MLGPLPGSQEALNKKPLISIKVKSPEKLGLKVPLNQESAQRSLKLGRIVNNLQEKKKQLSKPSQKVRRALRDAI